MFTLYFKQKIKFIIVQQVCKNNHIHCSITSAYSLDETKMNLLFKLNKRFLTDFCTRFLTVLRKCFIPFELYWPYKVKAEGYTSKIKTTNTFCNNKAGLNQPGCTFI